METDAWRGEHDIMGKYVIQRILAMLLTLFIIITIGFVVIRLMPGGLFDDAVDVTYEQRMALEEKYNLDKPIPVQYFLFLNAQLLNGLPQIFKTEVPEYRLLQRTPG